MEAMDSQKLYCHIYDNSVFGIVVGGEGKLVQVLWSDGITGWCSWDELKELA